MAKRRNTQKVTKGSALQQRRYYVALAAYNTAIEERDRRFEPYIHLLETEAGIDEFVPIEERIENELQIAEFRSALREAEDLLIKWAIGRIKADPIAHDNLGEISLVARVALSGQMPSIRKRVIEMSMRMAG